MCLYLTTVLKVSSGSYRQFKLLAVQISLFPPERLWLCETKLYISKSSWLSFINPTLCNEKFLHGIYTHLCILYVQLINEGPDLLLNVKFQSRISDRAKSNVKLLSLILCCHLWLGSPDIDGRRNSADQDSIRSCAYCCRPTSRVWDRPTSVQNLEKANRSHYTHMPISPPVWYSTQSLIKRVHQRELVQWGRQQVWFGEDWTCQAKCSFNCGFFITPTSCFVCLIFLYPDQRKSELCSTETGEIILQVNSPKVV